MLADKRERCTASVHLVDIHKKKTGLTCRCGRVTGDYEYIGNVNFTMRVKLTKKTDFKGVD